MYLTSQILTLIITVLLDSGHYCLSSFNVTLSTACTPSSVFQNSRFICPLCFLLKGYTLTQINFLIQVPLLFELLLTSIVGKCSTQVEADIQNPSEFWNPIW